jgi:hypothetical protein
MTVHERLAGSWNLAAMIGSPFGVSGRLSVPVAGSSDMTPRLVVVLAPDMSVFSGHCRVRVLP